MTKLTKNGIMCALIGGIMENIELYKQFWPKDLIYDGDYSRKTLSQFILESPYLDLKSKALHYYGNNINNKEFHENRVKTAIAFRNMGIKENEVVFFFLLNTPELFYSFYGLNDIGGVSEWFNPKGMTPALVRKYINDCNIKYMVVSDVLYPIMKEAVKGTNIERVIVNSVRDSFTSFMDLKYMTLLQTVNGIVNSDYAQKVLSEKENESLIQRKIHELDEYSKEKKIDFKLAYHTDQDINSVFISWNDFINTYYRDEKLALCKYEDDRTTIIMHTGGTTGPIKRIALTDKNMNSVVYKLRFFPFDVQPGQKHLQLVPPLAAWSFAGIHMARYYNMLSHIITTYDKKEFADLVLKTKANHYYTVPDFAKTLASDTRIQKSKLDFIKSMNHGGEGITKEKDEELNGLIPNANHGYGLNEATGGVIINVAHQGHEKEFGCCGVPLPGTEYIIIDPDTKKILPFGKNEKGEYNIGEICIFGDSVMKGYIGEDEHLNEKVFININGKRFFRTGDLGWGDAEGKLWYHTREARIIRTQDGKVFATVLENIISKFQEVKECCVVAIPDEKVTKKPSCHLVLKDEYYKMSDEQLSEIFQKLVKKIDTAMDEMYTFYEISTYQLHSNDLPTTAFGKTDYRQLESEDAEEYNRLNKNVPRMRYQIKNR